MLDCIAETELDLTLTTLSHYFTRFRRDKMELERVFMKHYAPNMRLSLKITW